MAMAMARRRGRPNDLRSVVGEWQNSPSGYLAPRSGAEQVHDRKAKHKYNSLPVPVEIDDPYGLNFGDRIVTVRETRNDPLADMRSRGQIEECDYRAGRRWQDAYENSQIGSVRAIDPTKEAVDGGRMPDMLTDRQRNGARDVAAARGVLGNLGNVLVHDVLGEGLSINSAAQKRGMVTERERRFLGGRFRECLGELAILFGLAMKPRTNKNLTIDPKVPIVLCDV